MALLLFDYALELCFSQLHQLERLFVLLTYIITISQTVKVELEMEHLLVLRVVIVADDGHTIIQLEGKRVDAVVD